MDNIFPPTASELPSEPDWQQALAARGFLISKLSRSDTMETSPEQHSFIELVFVLHGAPRFRIGSSLYPLSPGKMLIIGAGLSHQMIFSGENSSYERVVAYIAPEYMQMLADTIGQGAYRQQLSDDLEAHAWMLSFSPDIRTFIASTLNVIAQSPVSGHSPGTNMADDLWRALFSLLLHSEGAEVFFPEKQEESHLSPLSVSVLQYIDAHYTEELSLEQLAGTFYTSKNNMMSTFRKDIGTSIYNYLLQRRAAEARHMLLQGVSPTEAAIRCGFRDYSNFYRAFAAIYGCGPREYVRKEGAEAFSDKV